jgi:hypothetical protein
MQALYQPVCTARCVSIHHPTFNLHLDIARKAVYMAQYVVSRRKRGRNGKTTRNSSRDGAYSVR